ncbi:MAG: hypothetical protein K2W96_00865 [Gemmataceae bacterium]|nr:hypothetical protein [Gemmataceae bacterium]
MPMHTRMPVVLDGDEAGVARESARRVASHLGNGGVRQASLTLDGETVALPASAVPLLADALGVLGRGEGAAVSSLGALVTVEEAGDLLGESPARMGRLIADGVLPMEGGKLPLASVLAHRKTEDEARSAVLAEMVALSQEWNLP